MPELPTQDEVLAYFDSLSNWGRWGGDDELGTTIEIGLYDDADGIGELMRGGPVELAGEEHDGTIAVVGEGNLSHDAPSGRGRRRRDG